jgi:hypothetical protein
MLTSRTVKFFLSLPGWWLLFFTIKSALLVSKNPEWLGLYSTPKISFIICSIISCALFFYFIKKLVIPNRVLCFCESLVSRNILAFIVISFVSALPFLNNGVHVGEDIGEQVKSSVQWMDGTVDAPNILSEPKRSDLSINQDNWSLRPPGAAILPLIGMLFGLSLGQSIKLGLFLCAVIGGVGWLIVFKRFNIDNRIIFIVTIFLGLKTGTTICHYSTANIILFALVPWFLLVALLISERLSESKFSLKGCIILILFLFFLGLFAWIKLSGIIVSGTIGACLFFFFLNKYNSTKRIKFIAIFGLLGIFFWIPLMILEETNHLLTGITADQLYGENDSDIQAPLFGKFWGESTKGIWLLWSLISAPGYSLPIKEIAHHLRDFGIQFGQFSKLIHSYSINEHVLICGLAGFIFTIILVYELKRCWKIIRTDNKITICCFLTLPFIGLGILAYRYEWNYLLYHAHTFEYWLIFAIPTFLVFSSLQKLKSWTVLLFGVIVALPLTSQLESKVRELSANRTYQISLTEKDLGLSPSRFSAAIDAIEEDSNNELDIVFFLPQGDMSDLILRTKMRTMAIHFAGDNLGKKQAYQTTRELNVYCAYDAKLLENKFFTASLDNKFPQRKSKTNLFSKNVIVDRINLVP